MDPKRYIVIAGSHAQYQSWCRENRVDPRRGAIYVGTLISLAGLHPSEWQVVTYGTPHPHAYEIRQFLEARGFEVP